LDLMTRGPEAQAESLGSQTCHYFVHYSLYPELDFVNGCYFWVRLQMSDEYVKAASSLTARAFPPLSLSR